MPKGLDLMLKRVHERRSYESILIFDTQSGHTEKFDWLERLEKLYIHLPCLAFIMLGKSLGVKHAVLPAGQLLVLPFTVLAG